MNTILFESDRLLFREWQDTDLPAFVKMNADPEVMHYYPSTQDEAYSQYLMGIARATFEQYGYCAYAVDEKSSGEFIGFIGFIKPSLNLPHEPYVEIGWRLNKPYWNKGYATEGAARCIEHGWSIFDADWIYAWTAVINLPSVNVMKKVGMTLEGSFMHNKIPEGHPLCEHVYYSINRIKNV